MKGVIRLKQFEHDPTLVATWKNVIRKDPLLVHHLRTCMRTLRLAGIIPTWGNFVQTPYYSQMRRCLDREELAKYRAWWEVIFEISDGADLPRPKALFMLAVIVREQLRRSYGKEMIIRPERYGLTEEEADRIKDHTLRHFEGLTKF